MPGNSSTNRRTFLKSAGLMTLGVLADPAGAAEAGRTILATGNAAANVPAERRNHRVLVLGVDGMDPVLLQSLFDVGQMPNFAQVAAKGAYKRLGTSMPPQSPVAWSNFICGAHAGVHQIYDFVHRDPRPSDPALGVRPYLSTSRTVPPESEHVLNLGKWRIPLTGGETELLRRGGSFWDELVAHGIDTAVYRVPANYPAPASAGPGRWCCLAGMGTPDLMGTYGEFTCFTTDTPWAGVRVSGGRFVHLDVRDHYAEAILPGPANPLQGPDLRGRVPQLEAVVKITRDPVAKVAKLEVGAQIVLLNEGEWSDWLKVRFETGIPGSTVLNATGFPATIPAIVRFHLKQVHPELALYVSPLNLDPTAPVTPISVPDGFAGELAGACGLYYTTGIPEDTKALRAGALKEDEFLAQVRLKVQEHNRQYYHALQNFKSGLLFYYFGHTDQLAHMFWRDRDPDHPGRVPAEAERYGTVIEDAYRGVDELLGETLKSLNDDDTLIIMSDHGFTTFRRGFSLNTWLLEQGYLQVRESQPARSDLGLGDIDWSRTRAYALGINSLYLNLSGREKHGIVQPGAERMGLLQELTEKLREARDTDGICVVNNVYETEKLYAGADPEIAPDLLVGYARGYRASWNTVLGGFGETLLEDNLDRWSGTHLIDPVLVPGILVTNRKVVIDDPTLSDIAPTILREYGLTPPAEMTGRALFADSEPRA